MFGQRSSPRMPSLDSAPAVRKALHLAHRESVWLQHSFVGTEHLLLGMAQEPTGAAILERVGVTAEDLRAETVKLLGGSLPDGEPPAVGEIDVTSMKLTQLCQRVLRRSVKQARAEGASGWRIEHLFAGIVLEGEGVANAVLYNLGVTSERLRAAVRDAPAAPAHGLRIDDASDASIYEQLVSQVREGVATGRLRPGQRLPSVRALADELDIAPGTVARAYTELERLGVVVTEGARGTRIAEPPAAPRSAAANPENLAGLLRPVVVAAFHLGATAADLRDALERAMKGILNGDHDNPPAG